LATDINDHTVGEESIKRAALDAILTFTPALLARPVRVAATVAGAAAGAGERVVLAEYGSVLRGGVSDVATNFGADAAAATDGSFTNLGNVFIPKLPTAPLSTTSGTVSLNTAGDAISVNVGEFNGFWRQLSPAMVDLRTLARSSGDYDNIIAAATDDGWTARVITQDEVAYRIYGRWPEDAANGLAGRGSDMVGRFASPYQFASLADARASLALLDEFNAGTQIAQVRLSPGTIVFQSRVAPQTGALVPTQSLTGGGLQLFIPDQYISLDTFVDLGPFGGSH
jgi:hypothetical protein